MAPTPDDRPPAAEDDLAEEHLPLTDLEIPITRPRTFRKRGIQIALVVLAFSVASVVWWSTIGPDKRPIVQPSAPLTTVSALLVSNVTHATVTLNGQKLAGQLPRLVSADLEIDEVTITAPLFRQQTCQFKGLLTKTDDPVHCMFAIDRSAAYDGPPYIMGVFLLPDDLLPGQQNQTIEPIIQQLTTAWQTAVPPGDYIPTAFIKTSGAITDQRAAAPLQAIASFEQGPGAASPSLFTEPFSPECAPPFCLRGPGLQPYALPDGQVWEVGLQVMLRWSFTDSAGDRVASVSYPSDAQSGLQPIWPAVEFVYDGSSWHLAAGTDLKATLQNTLCGNGVALLDQRLPPRSSEPIDNLIFVPVISNQSTAGCMVAFPPGAPKSGTFLWRFGVLLAADAGARALLPDLPIAPPAEVAEVSG